MAESADVLSAPHQKVILPDLAAGCSMADMAAIDQLETCWEELAIVHGRWSIAMAIAMAMVAGVIPVTYINSSAAIKAFVGERGGIVCTSTNCAATLRWAWERGERVLFLPDQHLGRNTADKMGVPLDRMVVWDPHEIVRRTDAGAASRREDDLVEGPLLRPRAVYRGADRAHPRAASRRPRDRASGSAVGRRAGGRRQRLDRIHHPPGHRERSRIDLGGRHRDPSRQPARAERQTGEDCAVARPVRVPVLDDVPRVAEPSALDSRRAARRAGAQPNRRPRRAEALDARSRSIGCFPFTNRLRLSRRTRGPSTSAASLCVRRARAAYRCADDADPSWEASSGVCDQPECRAREVSRAAGEEHRGSCCATSARCRRTSARPCATTAAVT